MACLMTMLYALAFILAMILLSHKKVILPVS
jgi:hypothetical protein